MNINEKNKYSDRRIRDVNPIGQGVGADMSYGSDRNKAIKSEIENAGPKRRGRKD